MCTGVSLGHPLRLWDTRCVYTSKKQVLLLLVEVVSSACKFLFELVGVAEGVSPLSFLLWGGYDS